MPIGNSYFINKSGFINFINKYIIGIRDLHSHYRIGSLIKYAKLNMITENPIRILEVGCGIGINLVELNKINKYIIADGFDLDNRSIETGKSFIEYNNINNIQLHHEDITKFGFNKLVSYDFILFIDILEHIIDDKAFLYSIKNYFIEGTEVIISVPTKKYKNIFGEEFHKEVGHVRDGYNLGELLELFTPYGLKLKYIKYNSGLIGQIGLSLFYRTKFKNPKIERIYKLLIILLFRNIDFFNSAENSCSMFVVLNKKKA